MEQRCRDDVEQLYHHRRIDRSEIELSFLDADLFSEKTWLMFGLGKRELAATGAVGGAAAGAMVDAHLAGASLLTGAVLGAGLGGFLGWWTANRLVRVKVMELPLGGRRIIAGPTRNVNFPHIVFNRARLHHSLVAHRNHAVRGQLAIAERPEDILPALTSQRRSLLERWFGRLRKRPSDDAVREPLRQVIEEILADDEHALARSAPLANASA